MVKAEGAVFVAGSVLPDRTMLTARICRLQQGFTGERREHPAIAPTISAMAGAIANRHRSRCITVEKRLCGGACHTPRSLTMQEKALSSSDGKAYLSGGCDQGNVSPTYAPAWVRRRTEPRRWPVR